MTCGRCGHSENQVDFCVEVCGKLCEYCKVLWEERKRKAAQEFMSIDKGQ